MASTYCAATTCSEHPVTQPDSSAKILRQLHFRYELGFQPEALDGKRHKLFVKLADAAREQHKGVRLRYRLEYVPMQR